MQNVTDILYSPDIGTSAPVTQFITHQYIFITVFSRRSIEKAPLLAEIPISYRYLGNSSALSTYLLPIPLSFVDNSTPTLWFDYFG
ncbi:hypothetical protein EYC80_005798 [Monilinia laxa]|uniref:Uncharacterized protein n=1 Tax=Monilinia laxa TaxID=61186 RepID=A0A5N6KFA1_MONLA|nr:hypothetical protein EYC80_005798 [Monilinia laxa]